MSHQKGPEVWQKNKLDNPGIFDGVKNPEVMFEDGELIHAFDDDAIESFNKTAREERVSDDFEHNRLPDEERTGLT